MMKYLKTYLESKSEKLFQKMKLWEIEEYTDEKIKKKSEDFTDIEIEAIKNKIPSHYNIELGLGHFFGKSKLYINNGKIIITKVEDEWYYISVNNFASHYRCDGWDGLMDCLRYLRRWWKDKKEIQNHAS